MFSFFVNSCDIRADNAEADHENAANYQFQQDDRGEAGQGQAAEIHAKRVDGKYRRAEEK